VADLVKKGGVYILRDSKGPSEETRKGILTARANERNEGLLRRLGTSRMSKARNWKCPCGSGKKVKHCCGKEKGK